MAALQRLEKTEIEALLSWYDDAKREFPWRSNPDPYWVWLAEIMSQQTVMAALMPYFRRFIERFPSVEALARASEDDVLAAWTGLGYYSRARNLHRAAKAIVEASGFPRDLEGWRALPGVGPYTAAAVASQCFGVAEPVWDGNVTRVIARLAARADVWNAAFRGEMEDALRVKMQGFDPSRFNQAMMELGATICTPQSPTCSRCPLTRVCTAHELGDPEKFPVRKPRKQNVEVKCRVKVRLRALADASQVWLTRRSEHRWFSGMWDFPSELGGVAEPRCSLDFSSRAVEFGTVRHQITHHKIELIGLIEPIESNAEVESSHEGAWVSLDELLSEHPPLPLATTARKMLKPLMSWLVESERGLGLT